MSLRNHTCFFSFLLVLTGFAFVLPVAAQQTGPGETRVIPVGVYDKEGRLIPSLNAAQLHVRVGKERIPVRQVSLADAPRRIVLLLDVSRSTGRRGRRAGVRLARALIKGAEANDLFALGCFSYKVQIMQPLTDNQPELLAGLDRLEKEEANGRTVLFDALEAGVEALARSPQFGDAVVVITDGLENASDVMPAKLRDKALQAGVRLFAMILQGPSPRDGVLQWWYATAELSGRPDQLVEPGKLREVVSDTGGFNMVERHAFYPGNTWSKRLLELASEFYGRIRTLYRVELELAKPIQKPTKIEIEVRDKQGRKLKDVELNYPRYLLPLSTHPSSSPDH